MTALRFLLVGSVCWTLGLLACAQSAESESDGSGAGAGTASTTTTTTTSDTTDTTTTTTGPAACQVPQHMCGQVCANNTPQTGCYLSTSCQPCPSVAHGTTLCSDGGECDVLCVAPYEPADGACNCPFDCCEAQDCQQGWECRPDTHTCVEPCDDTLCMLACFAAQTPCIPGACCGPDGCPCDGLGAGGFGM